MKNANDVLLCHSKLESAIVQVEEDCEALRQELKQLEHSHPSGAAERPVLITDRVRQVQSLLEKFRKDKPRIERRKIWFRLWRHGIILAMAALGAGLLSRGLGVDDDFALMTTAGVFLAAVPLVLQLLADGTRIEKAEIESRRTICRQNLHSVRAMLLVIDSHVAAKPLWRHWCPASLASDPSAGPEFDHARDGEYFYPSIAIRYLAIASSLSRVCAKIAALYPQVLGDHELAREADALALIAFEIERTCLMKADLIRTFSACRGDRATNSGPPNAFRDIATREQPLRQTA